jgi:hypothetical protein
MAAKVNVRTGKIIGAKRGSFAWLHEKGHLEYDNSDQGITDGVNQNNAMYLGLLFLALGQFWWIFTIPALLSVIMILYYYIKEEFWCNAYAAKQLYKLKGGK